MEINYGVNNFIKVSLPLEKVYHDATLFGDGTKQKPLRVIGGGGGGASLPTMTGNSGKFLTTDGTVASWAVVNALPTQTGNSGKILSTNGTVASWIAVPTELPTLGTALQVLRVNAGGTALEYAAAPSATPAGSNTEIQFNNAGAFGASANLAWTGTNLLVNASTAIGSLTAPTARLTITSTGATAATSALLVTNSSGTETLRVRDDGEILINKDQSVTTQSSAVITVQSADTNTNLVFVPKGTGAIIAGPPPDGTAVGGTARGVNALDLQPSRASGFSVASGSSSVLIGGHNCSASGLHASVVSSTNSSVLGQRSGIFSGISNNIASTANVAAIVSGSVNTSSGEGTIVLGGEYATASLKAQVATSAGRFNASSDAQYSTLVMRRLITGTAITELFLDGSSTAAILPLPTGATNGRVWAARVQLSAVCTVQGSGTTVVGEAFVGQYFIGIKRIGSTTSIVGGSTAIKSDEVGDTTMTSSVVTVDNNDTNESLRVRFTPPTTAGADTVIRVVAKVELTEVGY